MLVVCVMSVLRRAGRRVWGSRHLGAGLLGLAALCASHVSSATDLEPTEKPREWQVWTGADASDNVWLLYTGVTMSPWSRMHEEGLKLRASGGYGEYKYRKAPDDPDFPDPERPLGFHARMHYADFFVGYLMRFGELTAKAFVGPSIISHDISPFDQWAIAYGDEIGVKGVLEFWLNIGERGWGSLDLSWSSAHETRSVRSRVGYRVWSNISVGIEAALNVDAQGECRMKAGDRLRCRHPYVDEDGRLYDAHRSNLLDYGRAGGFIRYELERGELSLSVGALGDKFSRDGKTEISPYATINWLSQF